VEGGGVDGSDIIAVTGDELVTGPVEGRRGAGLTVLLGAGLVLVVRVGIGAVVGWRLLSVGAWPADNLPASVVPPLDRDQPHA
jgi:hypothetical protein